MAVVVAVMAFLVVLVPAYWWAPVSPPWVPESLRRWGYDMRLAVARPAFTAFSLYRSIRGDFSVCLPIEDDTVHFFSGGLNIVASLQGIDSDAESKQPAVLLVHGSTPQGRSLGLYRVLAQKLAEKGYIVMSIDLRGFNQSDDPPDLGNPNSFDFVEDVANACFYLKRMPEIDPERIFLLGHSFGADVALSTVVRQDVSFKKLALIGPGRRFIEHGGSPGAAEFEYFRRRDMRYMQLADEIPADVYRQYRSTLTIENHAGYLSGTTHKPILLIDCELESREDQLFLKNVYQAIRGEKYYYTVKGADHYVNVANVGPVVFFDNRALSLLVKELSDFFSKPENG